MDNLQIVRCDHADFNKYLLKRDGKEIGYGYIFDRETNPIEIYIHEQYRSYGYGKYLFSQLLKIAKEWGVTGMLFEVEESNYRFITILGQSGAKHIGKNDGIIKFVLKIT